jgi:hypothetical protein
MVASNFNEASLCTLDTIQSFSIASIRHFKKKAEKKSKRTDQLRLIAHKRLNQTYIYLGFRDFDSK